MVTALGWGHQPGFPCSPSPQLDFTDQLLLITQSCPACQMNRIGRFVKISLNVMPQLASPNGPAVLASSVGAQPRDLAPRPGAAAGITPNPLGWNGGTGMGCEGCEGLGGNHPTAPAAI